MYEDLSLSNNSFEDEAETLENILKGDVLLTASLLEREDKAEASYRMGEDPAKGRLGVEVVRHTSFDPMDQKESVSAFSQAVEFDVVGPSVRIFEGYFGPYDDPVIDINKNLLSLLRPDTLTQFQGFSKDFPAALKLVNDTQENGQIISDLSHGSEMNRTLLFDIACAIVRFPPHSTNFTHMVEINDRTFEIDSSYSSTGEVFRKIRPAGLARDLYPIIRTFNGRSEVRKPIDEVLAKRVLAQCIKYLSHE